MHELLLHDLQEGRIAALGRAITLVENTRPGFESLLHALHPHLGRAHRIGITGPPGAGKSTLTAQLAREYRSRSERVGILAIDPTSPFTGGALLGDRIRMAEVSTDPGVFIRSMATRGSLGGLAAMSGEVVDLLDAFGFERVLTETVGVGQSELDIARSADTTVVVLVPEAGDSIQAMKAGVMEIADLFIINKADRPGADRMAQEIEMMLHLRRGESQAGAGHHGVDLRAVASAAREQRKQAEEEAGRWSVPVVQTVAQEGVGIAAVLEHLDRHAAFLARSGVLGARRRERFEERTRGVVDRELRKLAWVEGPGERILRAQLDALLDGAESPYSLGQRIVRATFDSQTRE